MLGSLPAVASRAISAGGTSRIAKSFAMIDGALHAARTPTSTARVAPSFVVAVWVSESLIAVWSDYRRTVAPRVRYHLS
jgi:hypothetical protein